MCRARVLAGSGQLVSPTSPTHNRSSSSSPSSPSSSSASHPALSDFYYHLFFFHHAYTHPRRIISCPLPLLQLTRYKATADPTHFDNLLMFLRPKFNSLLGPQLTRSRPMDRSSAMLRPPRSLPAQTSSRYAFRDSRAMGNAEVSLTLTSWKLVPTFLLPSAPLGAGSQLLRW